MDDILRDFTRETPRGSKTRYTYFVSYWFVRPPKVERSEGVTTIQNEFGMGNSVVTLPKRIDGLEAVRSVEKSLAKDAGTVLTIISFQLLSSEEVVT